MLKGKRTSRRILSFTFVVISTVVITILISLYAPAIAQANSTVRKNYVLLPGSDSVCNSPCTCPDQISGNLKGSFAFSLLTPTDYFTRFSMTKIAWVVTDSNGTVHTITGNGIYEINKGVATLQQMTLFLSIDGAQPETFESAIVSEQTKFPDIFITVINSACSGFEMTINAAPR